MADLVITTADWLNVREEAGAGHPVVTTLPKGTRVQRLEESDGWLRIRTDSGTTGWINARYAAADAGAPAVPVPPVAPAQPVRPSQPVPDTLTVTADVLNVREGAGGSFAVVTTLAKGTRVQRLEQSPGWLRIRTEDGTLGWISAKYASAGRSAPKDDDAPLPPPDRAPAAGPKLRVAATTLNLRASPAGDGAIVTQLPHGMVVQQVEVSPDGQWTRVTSPGGFEGWVSSRYVAPSDGTDPDAPRDGDPQWYTIAWNERGQKEHAGAANNPRILAYQTACTYNPKADSVAWCSSFANWVMKQAGVRGSGEANARSWLDWGQKLPQPRRGAVAVLTRPGNADNGHVSFYVGEENGRIKLLGGNQEDQVKISYYDPARVLSYRWPKDS